MFSPTPTTQEVAVREGVPNRGAGGAFKQTGSPKRTAVYQKGRKKGTIEFSLMPDPGATLVSVAGDFSAWEPLAMTKGSKGRFATTVALPPGVHEYRFIMDGEWMADPDHSDWAPNPYGSFNSVTHIQ
jgi:1,4-alpha-glucan branching enzyme